MVGYVIQRRDGAGREAAQVYPALVVALPLLLVAENVSKPPAAVFEVRTSIEIQAAPAAVWKQVVAFSELPEPTEWLFRLGIAYPVRAEIAGSGPGAVRLCVFSTGDFVEPIEVWDEPRLLKFSVTSNPPPMQEWTPYEAVHPPHLSGFLESDGGQFFLIPLPGGRTRLEGTTWYRHSLWPAAYWKVWSDEIIHQIHLRVLRHIKGLSAESEPGTQVTGQHGSIPNVSTFRVTLGCIPRLGVRLRRAVLPRSFDPSLAFRALIQPGAKALLTGPSAGATLEVGAS